MEEKIQEIWSRYQEGDHVESLRQSVEELIKHYGIDLVHIAGLSLMDMRRFDEGLTLLKAAVTFRPNVPYIYINSAFLCEQLGFSNELEYFCNMGLEAFPENEMLRRLKGNVFLMKGNFNKAAWFYNKVIEQNPDDVAAHVNLANTYRILSMFDKAEYHFLKAQEIDPGLPDVRNGLAVLLHISGKLDEAIEMVEGVDNHNSRYMLALYLLAKGDYVRGWKLHLDRWNSQLFKKLIPPKKSFENLNDINDKQVAVLSEGGFGDLFNFFRYVPMLAEYADRVMLLCPPSALSLLHLNLPSNVILCESVELHEYEYSLSLMDLPYYFETTLDTIPDSLPYLTVPSWVVARFKLPSSDKKRVGLVWAGAASTSLNERFYDHRRSINLEKFSKFSELENRIEFVSLQFGERAKEEGLKTTTALGEDFEWLETAAIVDQMDLIISVDTSVAHLSAAMGKPTWILSRCDPDWRWLQNRKDSPWYPGVVRVFGQKTYDEWDEIISEVKTELEKLCLPHDALDILNI